MSLILAIEPDRRQVAHLNSIVRHVPGAELILADTTERALESIGNNVPDLILVPALLSPQDDAALAAALRVIAHAAHVQMLTIPTFATPKHERKKGVLSAFRRKPANEAPLDGCDPKVFAEEIASYLERANEERAAAQLYEDEQDAPRPEPLAASPAEFDETVAPLESAEAPLLYAEDAFAGTTILDEQPEIVEDAHDETAYASISEPEDAHVESWAAATIPEAPVAAEPAPVMPVLDELVTALEESDPAIVVEADAAPGALLVEEPEALPEIPIAAAAPGPEMALDEFVTRLEQTNPVVVEDRPPVAAAPVPVVPAPAPAFEDLLADFERANLPVIEEVRAEQWMAEAVEPIAHDVRDEGHTSGAFEDMGDEIDIDLSIELEAFLHADEPAPVPEPSPALKPFEPVVPVERVEPFPMAVWQAWPRLDWTPPEKAAASHTTDDSIASPFEQVAEFEAALQEEQPVELEPFEPVVPVERFEPMPLAAWQAWPRLEGVAAEAYQEPIAPRKAVAKPEWVELMRSLREDIARRRAELVASEPLAPPAPKPERPRATVAEARVQAAKPTPAPDADPATKRPKRTRPIEDEWGLFDPEQCGFAALLDKLDEITVPPAKS